MDLGTLILVLFVLAAVAAVGKLILTLVIFLTVKNDALKVADHGATWWRHWRANELQQFNRKGPIVKVGSRSFKIRHLRSDESNEMFPNPGLPGYVLVQERLLWVISGRSASYPSNGRCLAVVSTDRRSPFIKFLLW